MKEAEGNEVEEVRGGGHRGRRGKWWIVLVAVLVLGAMAGVFCFRGQGVGEQLRAMAIEMPGAYREEARGPGWYVKLADKYNLPVLKRPVAFVSNTVSDEDMVVVGRANTLRVVDLTASGISDAGSAHLSKLTELRELFLNGTKVSDAGMAHLRKLKNLRMLNLNGTEVTDEGLALLCGFGNLHYLDLGGTRVTDAGLVHLKSLKRLTYLGLSGTRVTSEGVADLKSAIPKVRVGIE